MKKTSDLEIIKAIKSNGLGSCNSALESIYLEHYTVVKSFVLKNNGSEIDAEDIFQEAVLVFYEKIRNRDFKLTSSIRTYIYSVGKNLWLNKLKSKHRYIELNTKFENIPIEAEVINSLEQNELSKLISKEVSRIGEDCKKVLFYYYYDRMKMKKIAETMGFANDQVAKNRKSICMKKLKVLIKSNGPLLEILKKYRVK